MTPRLPPSAGEASGQRGPHGSLLLGARPLRPHEQHRTQPLADEVDVPLTPVSALE